GHFLEIPEYAYLYTNPDFEVGMGLSTTIGNANLEPQRTVSYEFGLQQQLTDNMAIDVTAFYKDVRNLLGTEIHETYIAGNRYALYINRDYGNIRGITFSLKKRHSNWVSANLDYTYGVAEGNASDPASAFYDAANGLEPQKQLVPLNWDQTHTLNGVITVGSLSKWSVSLVGRYGSGLPYTPEYRGFRISFENSERKPPRFTLDLRMHRVFRFRRFRTAVYMNIYNLLDRLNEDYVYNDTGRAGYSLIPTYTGEVYGPNTLEEYLVRPDFYSEPRQIKIGLEVGF
ncbi:MAG TPA: TonB-dependent receptor, partial [Bacteroidetes bacterium]|nr:TonB-dependent receptor [Bacteroidota bacterium]